MLNRLFAFSLIGTVAFALAPVQAAPGGSSLLGNWARGDGVTKVRITQCGSNLCATNTAVNDPSGDEKVGDQLVMMLKPKSASSFEGEAFDKRRNLHYSMKVSLQKSSMKTSGCVLGGIVCKDATWKRIR